MILFDHLTFKDCLLWIIAWIGHACIWCYLLNVSYAQPISKTLLKPWRILCGFMILFGFPLLLEIQQRQWDADGPKGIRFDWKWYYIVSCAAVGVAGFPIVTFSRLLRRTPICVTTSLSRKVDLSQSLGPAVLGDGSWRMFAKLPFNHPFTVEFTDLTLTLDRLPPALDGLTFLYLSDMHFCGTPSRAYFDAIHDEIAKQPTPDIVALGGDYADNKTHIAWLAPFLSRLKWNEAALALLGNHDHKHDPEAVRETLTAAGFTLLSNRWIETTIRGERVVVAGHEGPWHRPGPSLKDLPRDAFRFGLSHTPDNFRWAVAGELSLLLCGHTHGGQIRVPIIGSIFVPCATSRRYDQGIFMSGNTAMVVGRGLGGKEPIRINCPPQVLRITLVRSHLPLGGEG